LNRNIKATERRHDNKVNINRLVGRQQQ
jgi:hypothetical protein